MFDLTREGGAGFLQLVVAQRGSARAEVEFGLPEIGWSADRFEAALTPAVCELAAEIAPDTALRTLDALHLATFVLPRREIAAVALLTADHRPAEAAENV